MADSFARIDDALIDRVFQPLAGGNAGHLALGPGRAARAAIDLATLAWILAEAGSIAMAASGRDLRACVVRGLVVVAGLSALTVLRGVFARSRGGGTANPLRPGMEQHRAACLLWLVALAVKALVSPAGLEPLALLAVGACATAAVYLGACTEPPPSWREVCGRDRTVAIGRV